MAPDGDETRLDCARQLELVNGWIAQADSKVGLLLTVSSIITGLVTLFVGQLEQETIAFLPWYLVVIGAAATALLMAALFFSLRGLTPRVARRPPWGGVAGVRRARRAGRDAGMKNPLFFGDVAALSLERFVSLVDEIEAANALRRCYLEQIHTNSAIAAAKFAHVGRGAVCLVASIILYLLLGLVVTMVRR